MTNDNEEKSSALCLGPQEWIWFLQGKKLVSENVKSQHEGAERQASTVIGSTTRSTLAALPPTATIFCRHGLDDEQQDDDSVTTEKRAQIVAQTLLWLHKACFQDLTQLDSALENVQSLCALLGKRHARCEKDLSVAMLEYQALCDLSLSLSLDFDTTTGGQQTNALQEELHKLTSPPVVHLLQTALTNYRNVCKLTNQEPLYMTTLEQVLLNEEEHDDDDDDDDALLADYNAQVSNKVRMELKELLAFLQSRKNECKSFSSNKQSNGPAFMSTVLVDIDTMSTNATLSGGGASSSPPSSLRHDNDPLLVEDTGTATSTKTTLVACEVGLKQVLNEMRESSASTIVTSHSEMPLHHHYRVVQSAKERVEQSAIQLEESKKNLECLQQDMKWCRDRIASTKQAVTREVQRLVESQSSDENRRNTIVEIVL